MEFPIKITTKSGEVVTIRPLQTSDTLKLLEFINTLSLEQTYITFQGEQLTLKEEQEFIDSQIKKAKKHECVHLVVESKDKIIGNAKVELGFKVTRHVGLLGITIAKDYRDQSIGSQFFTIIMDLAKEKLSELRIVTLGVFANNPRAKHVYEKYSFVEHGRLPNGIFYKGEYIDEIFMYKEV